MPILVHILVCMDVRNQWCLDDRYARYFFPDTLIILLSVILLFFLVDWCWKPFISLECSSESAPTEDVAGPSEPSTPLVHAEEPPSYDQVILQDQQSSVLSWVGPQGSRQQQEDLAEAGASEDQSHASIHGISYDYSNSTYSSANEIQLSVDGLPSYNDVVAAMQDTTRPRTETGSGDGYSMLFIWWCDIVEAKRNAYDVRRAWFYLLKRKKSISSGRRWYSYQTNESVYRKTFLVYMRCEWYFEITIHRAKNAFLDTLQKGFSYTTFFQSNFNVQETSLRIHRKLTLISNYSHNLLKWINYQ